MPIKHRGRKERGRLGKLAALLIISMAFGSISPGKLYADFAMEVEPGEVPLVNDRTGHAPTAAERRERQRLAPQEQAEGIVAKLRGGKYSQNAAVIGTVTAENAGMVIMETEIGTQTILPQPKGELLPRIC